MAETRTECRYPIVFEQNKLNFDDFVSFIKGVSDDFTPPFLSYVNLKKYYEKVVKYGESIICRAGDDLAGILFFYCNDFTSKQAYASFLAVSPQFRKRGIAKSLMQEAISFSKKVGMHSIKLRTNNKIALNTYLKLGYEVIEEIFEEEVGLTRYYLVKQL